MHVCAYLKLPEKVLLRLPKSIDLGFAVLGVLSVVRDGGVALVLHVGLNFTANYVGIQHSKLP